MVPIMADLLRTQAMISKKMTMVKMSAVQMSRARFGMISEGGLRRGRSVRGSRRPRGRKGYMIATHKSHALHTHASVFTERVACVRSLPAHTHTTEP